MIDANLIIYRLFTNTSIPTILKVRFFQGKLIILSIDIQVTLLIPMPKKLILKTQISHQCPFYENIYNGKLPKRR